MRKLLLLGASLAVIVSAPAFAQGDRDDGGHTSHHSSMTFDVAVAAALAGNWSGVAGNHAISESQGTSTSIDNSYQNSKGVSNENQNAGANSALQNALALSYIQGCNCATGSSTIAFGATLAGAGNNGEVEHNLSVNKREDGYNSRGGTTTASITGGAYNSNTGVFQVNQNSGANSLLQNSAAVGAATGLKAATDLGVALADSYNSGEVKHNGAYSDGESASASIGNSFRGNTGMFNANQNTGANSQLQNSTAVAALQFCGCAADNAALTIAAAGNGGGVWGNWAHTENGTNGASMTGSFAGNTGVFQASQNAGANSLLQNSVAVGAVIHR